MREAHKCKQECRNGALIHWRCQCVRSRLSLAATAYSTSAMTGLVEPRGKPLSDPPLGSVMADYRFAAQVISLSQGRSVTAAAAYRSASVIADARTGEIHDYTRKTGVEWTGIMAPEDAPARVQDREKLWNMVERKEVRKDAQLAREVQLSLPHEL